MPTYQVTDPTSGKKLRLTGDSPPTEQELNSIFGSVSQPSQPTQPTKQPTFAEKAGDFLGIGNLARGAAQSITGNTFAPKVAEQASKQNFQENETLIKLMKHAKAIGDSHNYDRLRQAVIRNLNNHVAGAEDIASGGQGFVSNEQVAGSAGNLGALALGGLAPGGSTLARTGQGFLIGSTAGASSAANNNAKGSAVVGSGVLGGILGSAAVPVIEGASKLVTGGLKKGAEGVYNQLVKTPLNQVVAGQEKIGSGLLKRKISGNLVDMTKQVKQIAANNLPKLEAVIQDNANKKVDMTSVVDSLQKLRTQLANTPGESTKAVDKVLGRFVQSTENTLTDASRYVKTTPKALDIFRGNVPKQVATANTERAVNAVKSNSIAKNVPIEMNLPEAQQLKTDLQKAVSEAFLRNNTTGVTQAQKVAAQKLRLAIENTVPEVAPINKELEFATRATKQLLKESGKTPGALRAYGEALAVLHSPATLGAVAGERVLTAPKVATNLAKRAYQAGSKQLSPAAVALYQRLLAGGTGRVIGSQNSVTANKPR